MAHPARLCLAFALLACAGAATAQTVIPSSNLYLQSLQSSGVPFRVGNGFYTPRGCKYVVDYDGQCGGDAGFCNPASGVCADAQYPGACCPVGYDCRRTNAQYWQCQQAPASYNLSAAGIIPLSPFEQCGGTPPANSNFTTNSAGVFTGTACPDGYSCTYMNANYSQCTPNPQTNPAPRSAPSQRPFLDILSDISRLTSNLVPTRALAPGLAEYTFIVPGVNDKPAKSVDFTLNYTRLGSLLDGLLPGGGNAPPGSGTTPPAPPGTTTPPPTATPPAPEPPVFNFTTPNITFAPRRPLTISGTNVVDDQGTPVRFHGFNWFGFETGQTMVDGLYQNYLNPRNFSQVGDFSTIVYRQQALGFNTVRLPFRFADLNIAPPISYTRPCTADSQAQIIGNLTNPTVPYYLTNYANIPFPAQTAPILPPQDVASSGLCNSYLPSDSTLNRFLYVIQFFIGNGFYVAIDFHGQGQGETDRQIVANPAVFQSNWLGLLAAVQSLPRWQDGTMKGRLIFDLLNEPDAFNFAWNQSNPIPNAMNANSSTVSSWGSLYTDTAAALAAREPSLLFFVEGTGQRNQPGTAYGMGFGINPTIYTGADGLYNALGGLQLVASNAPVKNRTIISPHCYGNDVTGWTIGNTNSRGLGLPYTYYNNFAYLNQAGVPDSSGVSRTFPIVVGEFGNVFNSSYNVTLTTNPADPSSQLSDEWIHDWAEFANRVNATTNAAYQYQNINSSIWWDWNANSLPPLGLVNNDPGNVTSNSNPEFTPGWLNIQWVKINNLTDVLMGNALYTPDQAVASGGGWGLRPWYLPPTTH